MTKAAEHLPTEEEILARFHRLRIVINLSATNFGYSAMGQPGLVKRLETGHKLRVKNRRRCGLVLDTLEREHSVPVPEQKKNKAVDSAVEKENIPTTDPIDARQETDPIKEIDPIPDASAVRIGGTYRSDMED